MSDTLILSDVELEFIKAKRAKEEAEKAEREAAQKVNDAKKIAYQHGEAEKFKLAQIQKEAFVNEMWTALNDIAPNFYEFKKIEFSNNFDTTDGYGENKRVLDKLSINYFDYEFISKEQLANVAQDAYNTIKVKIIWYVSCRGSENSGWRMEISGINDSDKRYRRPRLVHEKIFNFIQGKKQHIAKVKATLTLQEEVVKILSEKYPEANVEKYTRTESSYSYNRYSRRIPSGIRETQEVVVHHPNGLDVYYHFSKATDGIIKINVYNHTWTIVPDVEKLVEILRTSDVKKV